MKVFRLAAVLGLTVALAGFVAAAEPLVSGPQVDSKVPGAFQPFNVNGESAGQKNCLVCQNGTNPVVMIFAREVTPEVTKLIKRVDQATAKHQDAEMGSFVVFCNDDKALQDQLKNMARDQDLKHLVLSTWDDATGPKKYRVNKDADVTVVLYTGMVVKANHAFQKGELSDKDVDGIVGEVSKILPPK
jgi:hypothetical protein